MNLEMFINICEYGLQLSLSCTSFSMLHTVHRKVQGS